MFMRLHTSKITTVQSTPKGDLKTVYKVGKENSSKRLFVITAATLKICRIEYHPPRNKYSTKRIIHKECKTNQCHQLLCKKAYCNL